MVINFVGKVSKIKDGKGKERGYRIDIPAHVTKDLEINPDDYIFIKAKKAEWHHMLEWNTMSNTWSNTSHNMKQKIIDDGLVQDADLDRSGNMLSSDSMKINKSSG